MGSTHAARAHYDQQENSQTIWPESRGMVTKPKCGQKEIPINRQEARYLDLKLGAGELGRRHDTVLRRIGDLDCSAESSARKFTMTNYLDLALKNNQRKSNAG